MQGWRLPFKGIVFLWLINSFSTWAELRDAPFIRQQEQQQALEQQITPPTPDVHLSPPPSSDIGLNTFPQETPCFPIKQVILTGRQQLPLWLPLQSLANQAQGHCLGVQGINLLMSRLQNRLIESGYITTRVLATEQNLNSGFLQLLLLPGKIGRVYLTPDSDHYLQLYSTFPVYAGELLDLRDIEQGLENLQRLPTVKANMEIVPGKHPGESDIALRWQQDRHWRLGASLDDSGSKNTGIYQAGLTLSIDNPFSLSDLFYLSVNHAVPGSSGKKSKNITGHYSLPFSKWMTGVTVNGYDYQQTIAGLDQDHRYSGNSKNLDVKFSRVLYRNSRQKTMLAYHLLARESNSYINDAEVNVQRRRTAHWRLGLQQQRTLWQGNTSQGKLDASISYQRGTRWFGALPALEEKYGEATALSNIMQLNAQLDVIFSLLGQNFRYNTQYRHQISYTPLTPQEQFTIGNRWTVRGYDGEHTLNADCGWYLRNDLAWRTPLPHQELYLGADYGEVSGHGSDYLAGKRLAGGVIGLRGNALRLAYDFFVGMPFAKPARFSTRPVTFGFNLNWQY